MLGTAGPTGAVGGGGATGDEAAITGSGSLGAAGSAALGAAGFENKLDLPDLTRACVLLIDGMGWELLEEHAEDAPVLTALALLLAVQIAACAGDAPAAHAAVLAYTRKRYDKVMTWFRHQGRWVRATGAALTGAIVVATLWLLGAVGWSAGLVGLEHEWLKSPIGLGT